MHTPEINTATSSEFSSVQELLAANNLPAADMDPEKTTIFLVKNGGKPIAAIGLEVYEEYGLLRSLVTDPAFRKQGIAAALVAKVFETARERGLKEIYLLTETASAYFSAKGFMIIPREQIPGALTESSEYAHVCPASALLMKKPVSKKKKVLFVCVENSNRSQMSQAFAKIYGGHKLEAFSAGSKPSGIVNPKAIAAMKELGYDLSVHQSKSLAEVQSEAPFDAVVTMGCGDACPWMPALRFIDWQIPDPRNMEPHQFNTVRDTIAQKVKNLVDEI